MLVIKISAEKSLCDPFVLPTVELKQITAVLHHIKRTFLVEFRRTEFYSSQCLNGLYAMNAKDVVQVPEMPLSLALFNLYMKQNVTNIWLLENI